MGLGDEAGGGDRDLYTAVFVLRVFPPAVQDAPRHIRNADDVLVRLHDTFDCKTAPTVTFGVPIKAVAVADLMENALYDLAVENNAVKLPVKNFEIITLKVTLA